MKNSITLLNKFCDAIWEYDASKNMVYFHYDDMNPELCGMWSDYNDIDHMYRENYLEKLDIDTWDKTLSQQSLKQFLNQNIEEDHFYIKFKNTRKGIERHDVYLQRMEDEKILIASRDVIEKEKSLSYLAEMPIAFCSIMVLVDEEGKPYDFQFTYCNHAHEELEGVEEGELLGKNFYEFFQETDLTWLKYYYETAYKGIRHIIKRYSPEIQKHLLIHTFQVEEGKCECLLLDVSKEEFLAKELESSRDTMGRILDVSTELVFQYDIENELITHIENGNKKEFNRLTLLDKGNLHPDFKEIMKDAFIKMKNGEQRLSVDVKAKIKNEKEWNWYRVNLFEIRDINTHKRLIIGFLQDINKVKLQTEEFRKKAQKDSLTGVYNAGTGKEMICQILDKNDSSVEKYRAMFVMDIDDFKNVNDTKGHIIGDEVLKEFAKALLKTFKSKDIVYRLGGDEFVVFTENIKEPEHSIQDMLNRLDDNINFVKEKYPFFSSSVGVFVSDDSYSFENFYKMADRALYETKRNNKGKFTIIQL